jgi:hypothetical protein
MTGLSKRPEVYLALGLAWLGVAVYQDLADPRGTGDWISVIMLCLLSLVIVGLILIRGIAYLRSRIEARKQGDHLFTRVFVKRFLIAGWLASLLYRIALNDVASTLSAVAFWSFTVGLICFWIWSRLTAAAQSPGHGKPGADH